jgi:Na+-driven multidrug efflux pump
MIRPVTILSIFIIGLAIALVVVYVVNGRTTGVWYGLLLAMCMMLISGAIWGAQDRRRAKPRV